MNGNAVITKMRQPPVAAPRIAPAAHGWRRHPVTRVCRRPWLRTPFRWALHAGHASSTDAPAAAGAGATAAAGADATNGDGDRRQMRRGGVPDEDASPPKSATKAADVRRRTSRLKVATRVVATRRTVSACACAAQRSHRGAVGRIRPHDTVWFFRRR